ncbi:hypothetical protein ACWGJ9_10130 [Curtobacterium citreum]
MSRNIIWVGARARISEPGPGVPYYGDVVGIDNDQVTVRLERGPKHIDAGTPETMVFPANRLHAEAPESVQVPLPKSGPLVLAEAGEELTSLMLIHRDYRNTYGPADIVIANAVPDFREREQRFVMESRHPWARDGDVKPAYRFSAEFDLLRFDRADEQGIYWTGPLSSLRFYDPAGDSPFKRATKPTSGDRDDAAGFPYQPPRAIVKGFQHRPIVAVTVVTDDLQDTFDWHTQRR